MRLDTPGLCKTYLVIHVFSKHGNFFTYAYDENRNVPRCWQGRQRGEGDIRGFCQNSEHFTLKIVAKIMNEVNFNSLEKLFKLFSSDTVIDNLKIAN